MRLNCAEDTHDTTRSLVYVYLHIVTIGAGTLYALAAPGPAQCSDFYGSTETVLTRKKLPVVGVARKLLYYEGL